MQISGTRRESDITYAISERNPGWVNLKPLKGIDETVVCAMNLGENGVMYGSIAARYDGYSAINMRNRLKQDGKEKYIENFKSNHTDWSIQSIEVDAPDVCGEPVNEKIEIEVNRPTEVIGKMIYITPILRGKLEENPLKQNERKLPIELIVPIKHSYMFSFVIPEGYKVDELPQSINLVTPDHTAILKYGIQLQGNRLHLVHSWQIKESFYAPDKFHDLKEFYAILVSKHNEQIVLKKVESN